MSANPIYPCLWFDGKAKEAAEFYCKIFKNAKITTDTPLVVNFELNGKKFMALNGGPHYQFTPAVSFVVDCEIQEEVDYYWNNLLQDGGREDRCGWLVDRYGVSWQIVPVILGKLINDPDRKKADRAMQAMLKMVKLDIAELLRAYNG